MRKKKKRVNSFWILVFSFWILVGCGSRKVQKQEQKMETNTEIRSETETISDFKSDFKIETDVLNFNVEPIGSIPATFSIRYKGEEIKGETTGRMNFSNEKKTEQKSEIQTKTESNIENKIEQKKQYIKVVERERIPSRSKWYLWLILGIILSFLFRFVWRIYKPFK